jgi:hypothetical protein
MRKPPRKVEMSQVPFIAMCSRDVSILLLPAVLLLSGGASCYSVRAKTRLGHYA